MDHRKKLNRIINADPRYSRDAYVFVLEALQYTRNQTNAPGHVTGQQLLMGIKDLALQRYGSMAKMVFEHWGITATIDFGNIVINMVNENLLSKTPEDKLEDFDNVYDFDDVFVKQYTPAYNKKEHKDRSRKPKH
jgi:uncharacterized repeat protein (TIGR04138 family)